MGNKIKARDYTPVNNPYAHIHFIFRNQKGEDLNSCMTTNSEVDIHAFLLMTEIKVN